jgi:hypothetical protein
MAFQFFSMFTAAQKRNIAIYIFGIMLYKFGLEYYNGQPYYNNPIFVSLTIMNIGAFITMANERFADQKYKKIGILTGLNSAAQCVGSILIAPLIKRFPTRSVL